MSLADHVVCRVEPAIGRARYPLHGICHCHFVQLIAQKLSQEVELTKQIDYAMDRRMHCMVWSRLEPFHRQGSKAVTDILPEHATSWPLPPQPSQFPELQHETFTVSEYLLKETYPNGARSCCSCLAASSASAFTASTSSSAAVNCCSWEAACSFWKS